MAAHDENDIAAAVAALDGCVKLGEEGAGPKASAVKLRGSRVHVVFLEQRNGQVELYRTVDAAKAAAMVAGGHVGHGGCTDRAYSRDEACVLARNYAARERRLQRRRVSEPADPDAETQRQPGVAEEEEAPGGVGAGAAPEAPTALTAVQEELARTKAALQRAEASFAAERRRSAQLEAESRSVRRRLHDSAAELTHVTRVAEAHSKKAQQLLARLFSDVNAMHAAQ